MPKQARKEIRVVLGYHSTSDLAQIILALKETSLRIVDVAVCGEELVRRAVEIEADAVVCPADLPDLERDLVNAALNQLRDADGYRVPIVCLGPDHPPIGKWLEPFIRALRKANRTQGRFQQLLARYHYPLKTLELESLELEVLKEDMDRTEMDWDEDEETLEEVV